MHRLKLLFAGALALTASMFFLTSPALALDHSLIASGYTASFDAPPTLHDQIAALSGVLLIAAERQRFESVPSGPEGAAAAPLLGPVYALSLKTDAANLIGFHMRC